MLLRHANARRSRDAPPPSVTTSQRTAVSRKRQIKFHRVENGEWKTRRNAINKMKFTREWEESGEIIVVLDRYHGSFPPRSVRRLGSFRKETSPKPKVNCEIGSSFMGSRSSGRGTLICAALGFHYCLTRRSSQRNANVDFSLGAGLGGSQSMVGKLLWHRFNGPRR
jgi:hypothetical protein